MIDIQHNDTEQLAPGQFEADDEHLQIIAKFKQARTHIADWRTSAREAYGFYSGDMQWTEDDKRTLLDQLRPVVVFNRTARTINSISGTEIQNRQEIKYLPRTIGDPQQGGYSDAMTSVVRWIRERCDAEDEESEAFKDNLICGMGWIETYLNPDEDPNGKTYICLSRLDPMEMLWDWRAKKPNLTDARWVAHIEDMDKDKFKELFPDEAFSAASFWNTDIGGQNPHDATNAWRYENDQSDKINLGQTTWVAQYQFWEKENWYKILSPDGNIVDFPEEKFNIMRTHLDQMGVKYAKYPKRVYKEYFLNNHKILQKKDIGCNHFTLQPMTAFRNRNLNTWFGIVELMKDPQRWANKWLSQIQHILNTSAKSGYFAEDGAFVDIRKASNELSKPGSITELNPGGLERIKEKQMPVYPEGFDRLLQLALQSINDVPGVNLELMGLANRDQPVGLEENRKQSGITILAPIFNSLRNYRKIEGRILAYYIREYIPDGEMIPIIGQNGMQYMPLIKSEMAFEYDIIVDDAPSSPNQKEKLYPILTQTVGLALQSGIPIPPDILDFSPLPNDLIQKWKALINQNQQDPIKAQMKQVQAQLAQLELQLKQAELQKMESEMTLNYAKSEQAHATGLDQAAIAQQRMDTGQAEQQIAYEQMLKDQARKDILGSVDAKIKGLQTAHEIQRKNLESLMKMQLQNDHMKAKTQIMKQQSNNRSE